MNFNSRKFFVWFISLGVVLSVYLLYNRISQTTHIEIDTTAEYTNAVADSNAGGLDSEKGTIGDVGIGTVRVARFVDYNEDKTVKREFGFEKLLHEQGDEWEIEKPFMNIFRRNYECYITADKGNVQVETAAGKPGPKEGTLTGNVVIHILPETSGDIQESFIYLDDVDFIGEKSQFSTAGPVKFVSRDARMLGTGAELIYNDELSRLEFLKIIDLQSLHLKVPQAGLFSPPKPNVDRTTDARSQLETQQPVKHAATDKVRRPAPTSPPVVARQEEGQYYKCLFRKNVVIDTPGQLVFADEFFINKIFWPKTSSEKSTESDVGGIDTKKVKSEKEKGKTPNAKRSGADTGDSDSPTGPGAAAADHTEPNELSEQFVDIIVTCDSGIVVASVDSPIAHRTLAGSEAVVTERPSAASLNNTAGRTVFVARRIDYDASTGDTVASGPSELTFYANDVLGAGAGKAPVPVKVTAQKKARFLSALNRAIFEGDCLCSMLREQPGRQQKYTLSAPKLTVDLTRDRASDADIKYLTAGGGTVNLATVKTAEEKLLAGVELKCHRFDFDAARQVFLATGPGVIKVDNSNISKQEGNGGKEKLPKFSLRGPCWAVVEDFDTLKYFLETNQLIADAPSGRITINYFPIVEGRVQYDRQVTATAGHIEALLHETAGGELELSTLIATGGITYEEEGGKKGWGKSKDIQFEGSEFFYDASKSMITVWGDESQPCLSNGVLVDGIEHNLKTGRTKFKIIAPGALQLK